MKIILYYLKARLAEASTVRGLVLVASGLAGYNLSDSDAMTFVAAGQLMAGILGAALPDLSE